MTIDEAIEKYRYIANRNSNCWGDCRRKLCRECEQEHEQIAEWLEELKDYQDKNKIVVRVNVENVDSIENKIDELSKYAESQYNKALDDLSNTLKENYDYLPQIFSKEAFVRYIDEYAEQLKVGVED